MNTFDTRFRNNRILMAETVDDVGYVMEVVLSKLPGYQVVAFDTTEELLAHFNAGRDRMVICSPTTPSLREGLLLKIRKIDPTIPFFFHSAFGSEEMVLKAKQAGANGWIEKPWIAGQLTEALRRFEHDLATGVKPGFLWLQRQAQQE